MDNQPTAAKPGTTAATASRAASVSVADFSEALSTGVLRAVEAQKRASPGDKFIPWIWAGWYIGNSGPFGPQLPGGGQIPGDISSGTGR